MLVNDMKIDRLMNVNAINKLNHVMKNNTKKNKNQHNDTIKNYPNFDNIFSLSSGTKDPPPVVIVSLRVGNKQRSTMVAGIICLWDSGANEIIIKRKHTKYYERRMRSNKVEYSKAAGLY